MYDNNLDLAKFLNSSDLNSISLKDFICTGCNLFIFLIFLQQHKADCRHLLQIFGNLAKSTKIQNVFDL